MKRRALFGLVGLTLGVSVIALVSVSSSRDGGTLTTAEVTEMELGVEVVGTLQAVDTSLVGPPMVSEIYSFKISMMAPEGTQVEKGTPVLGFDTSELMRKYQTRQTEMESVGKEIEKKEIDLVKQRQDDRLELAEAEARLRRADLKTATPSDLVSTIAEKLVIFDLELARIEVENLRRRMKATRRAGEAELAALKSNLDRATADVRRLQDAIARMTRTAPRDGVVTYVTDWRKEKKKVGDTVWIRSNVVEIPDLVLMRAAGEVEEALAGRIAEGQSVVLFLDAHPGLEFGAGSLRSHGRWQRSHGATRSKS